MTNIQRRVWIPLHTMSEQEGPAAAPTFFNLRTNAKAGPEPALMQRRVKPNNPQPLIYLWQNIQYRSLGRNLDTGPTLGNKEPINLTQPLLPTQSPEV